MATKFYTGELSKDAWQIVRSSLHAHAGERRVLARRAERADDEAKRDSHLDVARRAIEIADALDGQFSEQGA